MLMLMGLFTLKIPLLIYGVVLNVSNPFFRFIYCIYKVYELVRSLQPPCLLEKENMHALVIWHENM